METAEDGDTSILAFLGDLSESGDVCSLEELTKAEHENPVILGSIRAISPMVAKSSLQRQNVVVYHLKEIYLSDVDYVRKKFKIVFVGDAATAVHNSRLQVRDYLLLSRPKLSFDGSLKRDREFYKRFFTIGQWPGDDRCKIYFRKNHDHDWIPIHLNPEREMNQGNTAVIAVLGDEVENVIENSAAENPLKRKSVDDVAGNKKKRGTSETTEIPSPLVNQNIAIEEPSTSGQLNLQHITTSPDRISSVETEELSPSIIQNVAINEIIPEQSSSEQLIRNVIESSTPIEQTNNDEQEVVESIDKNESETLSPSYLNIVDQQAISESSSLDKENINFENINKSSSTITEKSIDEKIFPLKEKSKKSVLDKNYINSKRITTENHAIIYYETTVNRETVTPLRQPIENVVDEVLTKWPKNISDEEFTIKTHLVTTLYPAIDENSNENSIISFIRGYCNNCSFFFSINESPWLRENLAEFPLCPRCRKDEKIFKLRCELVIQLILQDEDDFSKKVYLMDKHAESLLGCTVIDLHNSSEVRRKAVEFLNVCKFEEGKNNKTLTVKITPILDKVGKWTYHVTKVQIS